MAVYPKRIGCMELVVLVPAAVLITGAAILWQRNAVWSRPTMLLFIAAVFLLRTLAERRKAVILTATEIIYRPAFARIKRISFNEIVGLKWKSAPQLFLLKLVFVQGVQFSVASGETRMMPMDVSEASEALHRVAATTGIKIE